MYAEPPLAWHARPPPPRPPLLTPEQQRMRKDQFAREAATQLLVGAGQLERESTPTKKPGRFVGFKVSLRDLSSGRLSRQSSRSTLRPSESASPEKTTILLSSRESTLSHSSKRQSHEALSDMFAAQNVRRRERTFIGSSCAACEEPLEHMLRGERILQLSCGHVSHEACFYEYIKEFKAHTCPTCDQPLGVDTSRGGNIDFDNINKLVRSAQPQPESLQPSLRTVSTHVPSNGDNISKTTVTTPERTIHKPSRDHLLPEVAQSPVSELSQNRSAHTRSATEDTAVSALSQAYTEAPATEYRPRDSDLRSVITSASRMVTRNPIPTPLVTVRSEFPTLTKSRHQQSLTCLITVEVPEGKWNPSPEDIRVPPPVPSTISQEPYRPTKLLRSPKVPRPVDSIHEDTGLEEAKEELFSRVENWHGLEFDRFGKLLLHGSVSVGKDRNTWQELECYLFSEMLICVKEKRMSTTNVSPRDRPIVTRWTLKGSILIKKHLQDVDTVEDNVLALSLSVAELPAFNLRFADVEQLDTWRTALKNIYRPEPATPIAQTHDLDQEDSVIDEEEYVTPRSGKHMSSVHSSAWAGHQSQATAPTEYSVARGSSIGSSPIHIPLDIVVVIPVSSSMQGLKLDLLRDSLKFMISNLGERDRLGIVTFGSGGGGVPLVGLSNKFWNGWSRGLESIRPIAHRNMRSDVVEGANGAMDMLMQRKTVNSLSHIILISDSATSDNEGVDFVVSRAEAAKISVHSFGLGLTHKPDAMVEMSTRTKASYTYVKDWMMLRECLAGCLGALQSTSHQNVKLKLRLPEGSPAKFVKINGALQITKRATGRDAEVLLGDLRFGDKREVLVQLAVQPDNTTHDAPPQDPWESMVSGLEAMSSMEQESSRGFSVEELPLLQADLVWGDLLRDGNITQLPRPSLLAITVLPSNIRNSYQASTPPIPPHPSVVQRRMELLTSDMLSRALGLVARGQHERAQHLLAETRSILKGLGKGGLPALPTATPPPNCALPPTPRTNGSPGGSPSDPSFPAPPKQLTPLPTSNDFVKTFSPSADIDKATMEDLDTELQTSLEYILHPQVFARDARKAVLQAIGTISSQRALTFRTESESLWAGRIPGVRRLTDRSRSWRDISDRALVEE